MADGFQHCGYCGRAFSGDWPRTCGCGQTTWRHPMPVAVLIVPVGTGVLAIRRSIPPQVGKVALPGGYVNHGETWQAAAARELFEETGVRVDSGPIRCFDAMSSSEHLIVFGIAPPLPASALP